MSTNIGAIMCAMTQQQNMLRKIQEDENKRRAKAKRIQSTSQSTFNKERNEQERKD